MKNNRSRPARAGRWSKILVPVDFSEPSLAALRYAKALAKEDGAALIVVHVIQPFHEDWRMETTQLQRAVRERARAEMRELVARELPAPVDARAKVRIGHPVEEIVAVARESGAELIVIATHGRSGLRHVLLGSVAERVVRHAPCPVLVVRKPWRRS